MVQYSVNTCRPYLNIKFQTVSSHLRLFKIFKTDLFISELPLEQASKLLEEPDFQDVFNKLPDEAFNLFGNNYLMLYI